MSLLVLLHVRGEHTVEFVLKATMIIIYSSVSTLNQHGQEGGLGKVREESVLLTERWERLL